MPSHVEQFIDLFSQSPPAIGESDIFACDAAESVLRAGAFAVVMNLARSQNGEHLIGKIFVIVPPLEVIPDLDGVIVCRSVIHAAEAYFGRTLADQERSAIDDRVKTIHSTDLRISAVVEALRSVPNDSAVIILNAASYRDEDSVALDGATAPRNLPEDIWVPHVVALARVVTETARNLRCYALMVTGEGPPYKEENQAALRSVPGCGVFLAQFENDPWGCIAPHLQQWEEQVKRGNIGAAFKSIDALPDSMDSQKSLLKLQLVGGSPANQEVAKLLRAEIAAHQDMDPKVLLRLARIAQRADEEEIACEMLRRAVPGLDAKKDLELALEIAVRISDHLMIEAAASRLEKLFPESSELLEHRLTQKLYARSYTEVLALLAKNPSIDLEVRVLYETLSAALQSAEGPDYANAIRAIEETSPNLANSARILCARDALSRREFETAVALCPTPRERPLAPGTARLLLGVIRELLISRNPDGGLAISDEQLEEQVLSLIKYLSTHPEDGRLRVSLASLLSVETSGSLGLAVAVAVNFKLQGAINLPCASVKLQKPPEIGSDVEIIPFLEGAMKWMAEESPLNFAVAKLPRALLTGPPDALFEKIKGLIEFEQDLLDPDAQDAFEKTVFVGALLAAHTSRPNDDIDMLRYAGLRLIGANRLQRARDLAEHALVIAGDSADRRRLAWFAYADIYHRAHNMIEALIGMACAFALDVEPSIEQIWHETYLFIRVLRDLRLTNEAKSAVDVLQKLTQQFESPAKYQQRLRTLELSLLVSEAAKKGKYGRDEVAEITRDVERHCVELQPSDEQIAPAVFLLAHCVRVSRLLGTAPSESAVSTLNAMLPKLLPSQAGLMQSLISTDASPQQLLALAKSIEAARNAEDIAFDLTYVAIAARRFLDSRSPDKQAESTIFAIELLTDHAIRGALIGTPRSPFNTLQTTSELAAEVSQAGIRVVFAGLGESGRLVRVNVEHGRIQQAICEDQKTFSISKLEQWSETCPYGYADFKDPLNLFYVSTDGLGLSLSPSPGTVLVMDTSLQRLPPNLVRLGDEFAGRSTPIASAPSMSWLWTARQVSLPRTGRMKAWISTETVEGNNPALPMVAERLRACLERYKIALDTGASVPEDLNDSELVIIAAHGGILPEGRYIQRLSDDAVSAMHPVSLANAVRGSSIVILFVCSGGRVDPHPSGETTVGLVKELFHEGCLTVIASPWPLEVGVPAHWLPVFLEGWLAGGTPIEATFLANKAVEKRLGDSPLRCLAMNVFGDPLRTKCQTVKTEESARSL
jgi:hypothetical protein